MSLLLFTLLLLLMIGTVISTDLIIKFPDDLSIEDDGLYRLDYSPPVGVPAANFSLQLSNLSDNKINFTSGLPGTKYKFTLYYTNSTIQNFPAFEASVSTVPNPPTNLSISVQGGKTINVTWAPPEAGGHDGFKLKLIPRSEPGNPTRKFDIRETTKFFDDLTPGATYETQLYSTFQGKESQLYLTTIFTMIPSTPARFIVWFRNETTLLIVFSSSSTEIFQYFKATIEPKDATKSEQFIKSEENFHEVAFYNLVPGRAYNVSVRTVSMDQMSSPLTAQHRTVPLRPSNVTFEDVTSYSFTARWKGPRGETEFDRYTVSIAGENGTQQIIEKDQSLTARFSEGLLPGRTYQVVVKTQSSNVSSWPAVGSVTTRPLPVINLQQTTNNVTGEISVTWKPDPTSFQDNFKIEYYDVEQPDNSSISIVKDPAFSFNDLGTTGGTFNLTVRAMSNGTESSGVSLILTQL